MFCSPNIFISSLVLFGFPVKTRALQNEFLPVQKKRTGILRGNINFATSQAFWGGKKEFQRPSFDERISLAVSATNICHLAPLHISGRLTPRCWHPPSTHGRDTHTLLSITLASVSAN